MVLFLYRPLYPQKFVPRFRGPHFIPENSFFIFEDPTLSPKIRSSFSGTPFMHNILGWCKVL